MFGLGIFEILVILVVIIVFVNPKDLPKLVRQIGRIYGILNSAYSELTIRLRSLERDVNPNRFLPDTNNPPEEKPALTPAPEFSRKHTVPETAPVKKKPVKAKKSPAKPKAAGNKKAKTPAAVKKKSTKSKPKTTKTTQRK